MCGVIHVFAVGECRLTLLGGARERLFVNFTVNFGVTLCRYVNSLSSLIRRVNFIMFFFFSRRRCIVYVFDGRR